MSFIWPSLTPKKSKGISNGNHSHRYHSRRSTSSYLAKAGEALAKKAGETAWEKLGDLYQTIQRKFAADNEQYAEQTLERLKKQPTSEGRQAALADILAEKAEVDPTFAQELERLVQDTAQDKNVNQFLTQVYGNAKVKNITNIGQARDVHID